MNMGNDSIVRQFSFGVALLFFFNFEQVHLLESPASSLTEKTLAQMRYIKDASQIYLKDIDWVRRDITEGVLHWSYPDFLRDIQILEQKWKDQKPSCFDSIDTAKEGLKQVVTEAETCLKQLEDTVQKVAISAGEVKTLEEADNVVRKMLAYKEKIGECKKIAIKMMPIHDAEKKKIEACVKQ